MQEEIEFTDLNAPFSASEAIRKLALNGELRCCMLALPPSLERLQLDVAQRFNIGSNVGRPFKLRYVDDEGDNVTFDSPMELHDAVQAAQVSPGACLKLVVDLTDDKGQQAPTAGQQQLVVHGKRGGGGGGKRDFHHFEQGEMEALLAQIEQRGFGQRKKRNARLLRKLGGDVDAVVAALRESDLAAGQRRQARKQLKLTRADRGNGERKKKEPKRSAREHQAKGAAEGFVSLSGINALYLDGNNMLFLTSSLRKHTLGRGQRWRAEAVLTSLAESFARAKTAQGLSNTVMIYDSITKRRCGVKNLEQGGVFAVASARPEFATSDDALVVWAKALPAKQVKASLFVTSDRELKDRLVALGALVAKPKQWVELARRTIEAQTTNDNEAPQQQQQQEEGQGELMEAELSSPDGHEQSLDDFLEAWGRKLVLDDDDDAQPDADHLSSGEQPHDMAPPAARPTPA